MHTPFHAFPSVGVTPGGGQLPDAITTEVLKIIVTGSKDKAPEVRAAAAVALTSLAECAPGGVAPGNNKTTPPGVVPLEATLALCVKGLDDGSMAVKLAFANAIAAVLSMAIEGENKPCVANMPV